MGNSASSPASTRPPPSQAQQALLLAAQGQSIATTTTTTPTRARTPSISPGPGNPHSSLRTKKRSLELPDLASLSLTPTPYSAAAIAARAQATQTKTQSIPIPVSPQANNPFNHYQYANEGEPVQRTTIILPSTTDMRRDLGVAAAAMHFQHPPSTHQPFPPSSRRDRRTERPERERQERQERIDRQDKQDREKQERQDRLAREQYNRDSQQQQAYRSQQAAYPRGRQQAAAATATRQAHVQRIQELYDSSIAPPTPPPAESSPARLRRQEVVRSSIPILLGNKKKTPPPVEEVKSSLVEEPILEAVPIKITWKSGGSEVILARAGDDDWKGRQPMQRVSLESNIWSVTVDLLPGTHHVRFLVDDIWRVADDLPAAVDDQGSLANYVAVPFPTTAAAAAAAGTGSNTPVPPTPVVSVPPPALVLPPPPIRHLIPGHSFWSAESSADGDEDDLSSSRQPKIDIKNHPHASPAAVAYIQATWTDVLPPELIEAAKEEEAYLNASAGQYDGHGSTRVTGFVPAPNIPPAPGLPRHLDKLILNSKVGEQRTAATSGGSNAGSSPRRGGKKDSSSNGAGLGGVGSGQAAGKRDRRDRDRDDRRERERGERERGERATRSRRGNVPPAPPPSETGDDDIYEEPPPVASTQSPYMPANLLKLHTGPLNSGAAIQANLAGSSSYSSGGQSSSLPTGSGTGYASASSGVSASSSGGALASSESGNTPAASGTTTPKQGDMNGSGTPTGQMSPHQTPPKGPAPQWGIIQSRAQGGGVGGGGAAASSSTPPPVPYNTPQAYPTFASQGFAGPGFGQVAGYGAPSPMERTSGLSGSRAITLDTANMPPLTDDNSVLPVPSHVVLHHLCTSAIRNGVLAVANTTRYRKKYLTTIYYKPT